MSLSSYWYHMTGAERKRHLDEEKRKIRRNIPASHFTGKERKRHDEQARKNLGVDKK